MEEHSQSPIMEENKDLDDPMGMGMMGMGMEGCLDEEDYDPEYDEYRQSRGRGMG